ncbi:sphingosine 1-phosphate receptor 2 [Lampris incognitus]|uniref:sphingosine 1-phosphate receptor 2 n=1 Tax=Lampris incognitus TaxID=2546036 RepID=UPI0024B56672|nr:sphingosine 1-phosphate receptor 2 [Lampris incognitus]XP_056143147.1 sphingosine 1-phosphate receptor 2 [Lampris incognitus]XP_056143148.1 sphingosine 1-phosphate receptor 2 [Lampris incognitus]XP_056143149.1 sphingosine 1-phosphate receptor 2 [Lampris incognitus]XP_056143150.1 sphingosine 1-phosphate receptor 2 [Lampris incognitus]XP_056143151.1 sphingosine 1-phosphate receptor 2 [Lampris incognitus]XP_056143152.1 sphingosine 1-phosphate receptor 2 [Lampris incognitus]XP_056143153.1 sph
MTLCRKATVLCHPVAMKSKYSQYYNRTLIQSYYAFAKNMTNQELEERTMGKKGLTTLNVVIVILCSIIILENLLVLIAVFRNKKFHSAMFFFIGNLAFSDLLAGSAYIANIFLSGPRTFELVPVQWFIREGTTFIALTASVFSLLAIAIERYIAITKVKVYGSNKTCRMFLLIGTCWVTSILLGGLPIIGWNCINDLPECSAVLPLYSKKYILFVVTIFSIILLSIVILYVRIYLIVRSSHQEATNSPAYALLKTVTIVLGVFIVCWVPAFTILLLDSSCKIQSCPILSKAEVFFGFATLNSALNPLIYTLRSKDMRKEFLRVLCCWGLLQSGRSADRCLVPLKSSSSLEHCTNKHEHQTTPIMQDCTTCV